MKALSLAEPKRLCLSVPIGLLATLLGVGVANAIGLNEAVQLSSLGEPLRIVIPVISDADAAAEDNLSSECAKLIGSVGDRSESGVPHLVGGRISLQRSVGSVQLVVTSSRPINDPVLSVTVQVGCTDSIRRQYTLLLDPPATGTSMAEAIGLTPVAIPANPRVESFPVARQAMEPAVHASAKKLPASSRPNGPVSQHNRGKKGTKSKLANKPKRSAPQASVSNPQLRVSRGGSNSETGAQPSTADVEVESVVLKRRVEELSAMVQRMHEELEAARAARDAAEAAVKRAPLESVRPSSLRALHASEISQEQRSQASRELLLFIMLMVLLALLVEMWSRRRVRTPLRTGATGIDLDMAESRSNHDKVFDNSEATMNPGALLNTEEAPPGAPAQGWLAPTARPIAAQAVVKRSPFLYDPELAFEQEIQSDAIPRTRRRAP